LDYQTALKGAGATQVNLNTGEKAEEKALAEYGIKQLEQAQQ
jgi:hypothetical protein